MYPIGEKLGPSAQRPTIFGMTTSAERRRRRSHDTLKALHLQLDACRRAGELDGMVLSDQDGLLLAATGDPEACDEIAAQLPLIGQRVSEFEGVLLSAENGWRVRMRRFRVGRSELYLAAIGGAATTSERELGRGIGGATRILAA